jgi:serine palmitoyltransferase
VLEKTEGITLLGHRASPIIHFCLRTQQQSLSVTQPTYDYEAEERTLQDIVEDSIANGVLLTRAKHLRGQEMIESRPTIRIAATAALTRKEVEKAAGVVKASVTRILSKRK